MTTRATGYAEVLRALYPRVLAKTLRLTRTLHDAEDAVQTAIERALSSWPEGGRPESPEAWLVTVAANAHKDRLRRGTREQGTSDGSVDALARLAEMSPWAQVAVGEREIARGWKDELLGLLFACCHPVLEEGESAALALATVLGLSNKELAAAFVTAPRTMEQRLLRARRRLRERGELEPVSTADVMPRLERVLTCIYLLFNEGYWSTDSTQPIRAELCRLAIGLARSVRSALPDEPEASALLALLLFHDGRRHARFDGAGRAVPLPEQARERWDRASLAEATQILDAALALKRPGPLQIEGAIAAVHCRAAAAEETEWREIAELYGLLETLRPTPAVRTNRAFAVARSEGAAVGFALLERGDVDVRSYPYAHVVRAELLLELGRRDEGLASLRIARDVARNDAERAHLDARLAALVASDGGVDEHGR